jgi:hypothetical protein
MITQLIGRASLNRGWRKSGLSPELSSLGILGEAAIRMDPGSWTALYTPSVEEPTHAKGVVTKDV